MEYLVVCCSFLGFQYIDLRRKCCFHKEILLPHIVHRRCTRLSPCTTEHHHKEFLKDPHIGQVFHYMFFGIVDMTIEFVNMLNEHTSVPDKFHQFQHKHRFGMCLLQYKTTRHYK